MKELIDKKKIYDRALNSANQGKNLFNNIETNNLSFLELIMLYGFTYIELLSQVAPLPNKLKNQNIRAINTAVQRLAEDVEIYQKYSKWQTELIIPTESKRVKLAKELNEQKYNEALQTALELIDIYAFGIANSNIYVNLLKENKNVNGE